MRKNIIIILRLIATSLSISFTLYAQHPSGITIKDDAKVGLIVTGTGNVINTTQIFGKSPEYAELKKRLDGLQSAITQKAGECEQMAKDKLPDRYRDNCRTQLINLNAEHDSVQKIETRFREDVVRLAETFSRIELNSERLRLAKQFFDEGKIREADNVLNAKAMKQEGDALLLQKAREQQALSQTDSLLRIKADEFALKAQLKVTEYGDSLRYDSAEIYFAESLRYAEKFDNFFDFAKLLYYDNQIPRSVVYFEKCRLIAESEDEKAMSCGALGGAYSFIAGKQSEAEQYLLQSLKIYSQLIKKQPGEYEASQASAFMNLGFFYQKVNINKDSAEKMYLSALHIFESLNPDDSTQYEYNLATVCMNMGGFYAINQKLDQSEIFSLRALEIYERLAKKDPGIYESDLAMTCMNMGAYYYLCQKFDEAEKMSLRALEIFEILVKDNPAQIEPDLANTFLNLGGVYLNAQKISESERMYLNALEIYSRLTRINAVQFEPVLAKVYSGLGNALLAQQRMAESEKMYIHALEIYKRLTEENIFQFGQELSLLYVSLGKLYYSNQHWLKAAKAFENALNIYEQLTTADPLKFESDVALACMNLGVCYMNIESARPEPMFARAQEIFEKLRKNNFVKVEPNLALTYMNLGIYHTTQNPEKAEIMYLQALEIYERLAKVAPAQFVANQALVLNNIGHLQQMAGRLKDARSTYSRALLILQTEGASGLNPSFDNFKFVYGNLASLRDSFTERGDIASALSIQTERAECMYSLKNINLDCKLEAALAFDELYQFCFSVKMYRETIDAATRVLELAPSRNWVRITLGHSQLLRGEWKMAKQTYERYIANEKNPAEAKTTLLKDLTDLEKAGITHPDIEKARAWLND